MNYYKVKSHLLYNKNCFHFFKYIFGKNAFIRKSLVIKNSKLAKIYSLHIEKIIHPFINIYIVSCLWLIAHPLV